MVYLTAFVIVSFLIFFHELGHFVVGRMTGIPIRIFSVGVGPAIWKWEQGETEYRISALPFGGYVMPDIRDEESFIRLGITRRIAFAMGGPVANLLLPVALFAFGNVWTHGFSFSGAFVRPWVQTIEVMVRTMEMVPLLFTHTSSLSGVVGIVASGDGYLAGGLVKDLGFASALSVNLAVLNLLPLPPLDGGKVLLYLAETVHHKAARLHAPISIAGWALVFGMIVYLTVLDVTRLIA